MLVRESPRKHVLKSQATHQTADRASKSGKTFAVVEKGQSEKKVNTKQDRRVKR